MSGDDLCLLGWKLVALAFFELRDSAEFGFLREAFPRREPLGL